MGAITVKVDTTKWKGKVRNYRAKVHRNLSNEIQATALEIDRGAKREVPVDTGRLRASIHPQFKSTTGFQYADGEGGLFDGLIQVNLGIFEAIVGTNVQYAQKIEDQTQFLETASKSAQRSFEQRLKKIFK